MKKARLGGSSAFVSSKKNWSRLFIAPSSFQNWQDLVGFSPKTPGEGGVTNRHTHFACESALNDQRPPNQASVQGFVAPHRTAASPKLAVPIPSFWSAKLFKSACKTVLSALFKSFRMPKPPAKFILAEFYPYQQKEKWRQKWKITPKKGLFGGEGWFLAPLEHCQQKLKKNVISACLSWTALGKWWFENSKMPQWCCSCGGIPKHTFNSSVEFWTHEKKIFVKESHGSGTSGLFLAKALANSLRCGNVPSTVVWMPLSPLGHRALQA